jgi:surface-anchored protein
MPERTLPSKPSKHQLRKKIHMKYTKTKFSPCLLLAMLLALSCYDVARATTTISRISSGHVDIFEAEYENDGTNAPTVHLGVHTDTGHYEPGDVLLEVGNSAYRSTVGFSTDVTGILGSSAWILPANVYEALDLGLIEAGVKKVGFPFLTDSVTFTMVAAGGANPGNFALFSSSASSAIRLSATESDVRTSSFSYAGSHGHYNWGFSAPGIYTFDMKASYTDSLFGALESATETYTFNVIPEPSSSTMLLIGLVGWVSTRKRVVLKE